LDASRSRTSGVVGGSLFGQEGPIHVPARLTRLKSSWSELMAVMALGSADPGASTGYHVLAS